jgi:glutamyl-tRNA(Gln) amidotransferase subunit D
MLVNAMVVNMLLAIISTGGTIATKTEYNLVSLDNASKVDWIEQEFADDQFIYAAPINILSEDATPEDWMTLAREIISIEEDSAPDGYIVLHGTDTMCFTSAAMSFMLGAIMKPVVFTGSRKSFNSRNTDVFVNTCDAVLAAREMPPGVYISFSGDKSRPSLVHLGTRCRKANLNDFQTDLSTFWSIGIEPVAEIFAGLIEKSEWYPEKKNSKNIVCWQQPTRASIYPGVNLTKLEHEIETDVIIEVYPSCTSPKEFSDFLKQLNDRGIRSYITTSNGRIGDADYPSTIEMRKCATLLSVTPETAYVKLGWALGQSNSHQLMLTDIAGEMFLPKQENELTSAGL